MTNTPKKATILRGEPVVVTRWKYDFWGERQAKARWVRRGEAVDAVGNTLKVKFTFFSIWKIRLYYSKWFNFSDQRYSINVKMQEK